jgi:DNA repair protein RAD5
VFSQFTSFLDLIEIVLKRERFDFLRFDGTMDVKKRNEAISEFRSPTRKPKVLIVSLKAGGVGLNVRYHDEITGPPPLMSMQLTAANHVFMVGSAIMVRCPS